MTSLWPKYQLNISKKVKIRGVSRWHYLSGLNDIANEILVVSEIWDSILSLSLYIILIIFNTIKFVVETCELLILSMGFFNDKEKHINISTKYHFPRERRCLDFSKLFLVDAIIKYHFKFCKQSRPWWDAAFCSISSGSSVFDSVPIYVFLVEKGLRSQGLEVMFFEWF